VFSKQDLKTSSLAYAAPPVDAPSLPIHLHTEQLSFLVSCVNEINTAPGQIVEIGCAVGRTTVFLNKHLQNVGIRKEYVCTDTFGGFVDQDISEEPREA